MLVAIVLAGVPWAVHRSVGDAGPGAPRAGGRQQQLGGRGFALAGTIAGARLDTCRPTAASFVDAGKLAQLHPPLLASSDSPHVASPSFVQSERLVVAPGHEERASLSMPGGQSGHPVSPHDGAGHDDWVAGRPTPLLAEPAQHVLTLKP